MSTITLNPTQHAVLAHAIHHANGLVNWFPENVKGGARQKVLQGLFNRALITPIGTDLYVAAEGYDALGCARPVACSIAPVHELEAAVALVEATWAQGVNTNDAVANESAPADQAEAVVIETEPELKADQHGNAPGCDDCLTGTDVPATEINATQGQPLPASSPVDQPLAKLIRTREHSKQTTIIDDFLGKSMIVRHDRIGVATKRFYTIYGHIKPLGNIRTDARVKQGDVIATLASLRRPHAGLIPHLHISLGWASGTTPKDRLDWQTITDPGVMTLLNPLKFLNWQHRVVEKDCSLYRRR